MRRELRRAVGRNRGPMKQSSGARAREAVRAWCVPRGLSIFGRTHVNRRVGIADAKGSSEVPLVKLASGETPLPPGELHIAS